MLPDFRVRQRDYLLEIARALSQELDLDTLLGRILTISIELLAGQAGLIALRADTGNWAIQVSQGLTPTFLRFLEPHLKEIPSSEDQAEFVLPELNRVLQNLTYTASAGFLTGAALPLVARQKVVGIIFIFRGYPGVFSFDDQAVLSSFANQAAVAVQNAQLYAQINRQKQRMDAILDSAADGILILATDNSIERCNRAFVRLFGQPQSEIIAHSHRDIIQWISLPSGTTLEQAEAGGWPLTPQATLYVEGDLKRPNSQLPLPVGISYAALISDEGTLLNIICTVRDITRFRQADELKSTFMSVISHELKTPVALIKGYVSTLRREDANWDPAIVQDSLAVIEEEADRLTLLIENLLDATRLQAGGLSIKRADIFLPEVIKDLARKFGTQTSRHTFKVDFPLDFPVILADETRISQVISNLISNAIKYSSEGEIKISGQIRPDDVVVCITDQGPGIAPEDAPHVFDRFYRGPEMARQTKGAGLGLFLSRAIVEAHKGRIWVDADAGQGARICFSLPRG